MAGSSYSRCSVSSSSLCCHVAPWGSRMVCATLAVVISFPPAVGHTTLITLCGYAYGMKGFSIAAAGSLFGAAVTFIVLRLLFSRRLRKWSQSNEKWQALETVIVCLSVRGADSTTDLRLSARPPRACHSLCSSGPRPSRLGCTRTLFSQYVPMSRARFRRSLYCTRVSSPSSLWLSGNSSWRLLWSSRRLRSSYS